MIEDLALTMHPKATLKTVIHLLDCFGTAQAVYAASREELIGRAELDPQLADSISRKDSHALAEKEIAFMREKHIHMMHSGCAAYPRRLKEIPDYPHVLYYVGTNLDMNSGHWLAVVGTRDMTEYGRRTCQRIVSEVISLCPDVVIVSGLAYGNDITAQRTAMEHGIPTVAVLGHKADLIYPQEHTEYARRMIRQGGAVITEYPSSYITRGSSFLQRNRLIAGMCEGTLIIESPLRGGSLNTARHADGYHRTVMAIPGRADDVMSEGTNHLIHSQLAQSVSHGKEVLSALGWESSAEESALGRVAASVSADCQEDFCGDLPSDTQSDDMLLQYFDRDTPRSIEEISQLSGLAQDALSERIIRLELEGELRAVYGNLLVKK